MRLSNLLRKSLVPSAALIGILFLATNSPAQVVINNQNQISPAVTCSNGQVITYNTTTGQWDTCAANAAAGAIDGSIAATQVAFGTGVDTIGGDNDFTWVDPVLIFTNNKGVQLGIGDGKQTITGGGNDVITVAAGVDDYTLLTFSSYADIKFDDSDGGGGTIFDDSTSYLYFNGTGNIELFGFAQVDIMGPRNAIAANDAGSKYGLFTNDDIQFVVDDFTVDGETTFNGLVSHNFEANNSNTVGSLGSNGSYLNIIKTNGAFSDLYYNQGNLMDFGTGGVAALGAAVPVGAFLRVSGSGSADNEYETYGSWINIRLGTGYTQTTAPTGLFTYMDMGSDNAIGLPMTTHEGIRYVMNNYYNGNPTTGFGFGFAALALRGGSPGTDATHSAANTYKNPGAGFYVGGTSTSTANNIGWEYAFNAGGNISSQTGASNAINTAFYARNIYVALEDVAAAEATDGVIKWAADNGDDVTDTWTWTVAASGNALSLANNSNTHWSLSTAGLMTTTAYATTTNCADSAGAAACGSAAAGHFVIDAAGTSVVVSTTAVTANSEIFVFEDSSLGSLLGVTCNTTVARVYTVSARTAGTSFTVTPSAAPVTNPACLGYYIVN